MASSSKNTSKNASKNTSSSASKNTSKNTSSSARTPAASSTTVKPPKKKKLTAEEKLQGQIDTRVASDEAVGRKLADEFYPEGTVKTLDPRSGVAKIANPGKIDRIDPNSLGSVDRIDPNSIGTTDRITQDQLGKVDRISNQMPGATESLAQANDAYSRALTRDQYVESALQSMQAGLGGYNSAENQALRAQAARSVNGAAATSMRALRQAQGANGVTGMSAAGQQAGVLKAQMLAKAQNETDILAKNVEEQRLRQQNFAQNAISSDQVMRNAQDAALKNLLGVRQSVADYQLGADKSNQSASATEATNWLSALQSNQTAQGNDIRNRLSAMQGNQSASATELGVRADVARGNQTAQGQDIANQLTADTTNAGIERGNSDALRHDQEFSIGQDEKQTAGRLGAITSGMATSAATRGAIVDEQLSRLMAKQAAAGVDSQKKLNDANLAAARAAANASNAQTKAIRSGAR